VRTSLEELLLLRGQARGFSFLPRQPITSLLSGRHASRLRGRGLAFEELRHYQQGDDIRTIDWRTTARLRSPHVRVYTEERERPVIVVVDQRGSMFFGSRRAMKSVVAAEIAALAAWRTLSVNDRVGGLVFNNNELVELTPHRSQTRVLRLLHEVVRLNTLLADQSNEQADEMVTLNDALHSAVRRATHDHLVVIISDLDGADDTTKKLATELAAHNDVLVVGIYDPLGAALHVHPGMTAVDRQVTYELPTGSPFADSFRKAFTDRLDLWMDVFRSLRVPVIPLSVALSPVEQLRELFGAHSQRRIGSI